MSDPLLFSVSDIATRNSGTPQHAPAGAPHVSGGSFGSHASSIPEPSAPPAMAGSACPVEDLLLSGSSDKPPMVRVVGVRGEKTILCSLKVHIDVHMGTALVTMKGMVQLSSDFPAGPAGSEWVLETPMSEDGTVTACTIHRCPGGYGSSPEMYYEAVVTDAGAVKCPEGRYAEYDPNVSRVPFEAVAGDFVEFTISYFEPVVYSHAELRYYFALPLMGDWGKTHMGPLVRAGTTLSQLVYVTCSLNGDGLVWEPTQRSIPMEPIGAPNRGVQWVHSAAGDWSGRDVIIRYRMDTDTITASCLMENSAERMAIPLGVPPETAGMVQTCGGYNPYPNDTNLAIIINPPAKPAGQTGLYARNFVFLLDKSGSMTGSPMQAAQEALCTALDDLRHMTSTFPGDKFSIILFDNTMSVLVGMQRADPMTVGSAKMMVRAVSAGGGTAMAEPVETAFRMLEGSTHALPFIVLVCWCCLVVSYLDH
eukprot:TRINITY_DN23836_c0_g1_i1.p1 TRINITY_DN23836_c0_g1~~TRINITY_DN23836_c0_g1_i1.p1  ORF type:complete len:489 (+),score=114.75 TRINITY_DN23836_c0_g1_i1:31-1467(+)